MNMQIRDFEDGLNPLDSVEEILSANNWTFNRMTDEELMVQVDGKGCTYRLFFIWQEEMSALQFCCQYDMTIDQKGLQSAANALMIINEGLWMGHFDIPADTGIPSFRHTCLMRGLTGAPGAEAIEDLVDVAMAQCERHYAVFQMLARAGKVANDQDLSLALMDTSGEA